jgi:hypothetical protein
MPVPLAPIDATKTLFAGHSVLMLTLVAALTAATAAIGTDVTSASPHGLANNQAVTFVSGTGFTGLTAGTLYYATVVDATKFKLSATPGGAAISITAAGSAGVFQPYTVLKSKVVDHDIDQKTEQLKAPDDNGVLRTVAEVLTEQTETFKFEVLEAKRLPDWFAGGLAGQLTGKTCQIWSRDPRDASGKVALKSEAFPCSIIRDGGLKLGDGTFSKATLKITSNKEGVVIFTPDATA